MGSGIPDMLQSTTSSSSIVEFVTVFQFLEQRGSITSNRFVLNIVKGHHIDLRCHLLFSIILNGLILKLFHMIILLFRRKWISHCPRVPLNHLLVVLAFTHMLPKWRGGLWPIPNLKWFNPYMHIPTFKMPIIRQIWGLIQQGTHVLPIDFRDTICIFLLLSIMLAFYVLFSKLTLSLEELSIWACHIT